MDVQSEVGELTTEAQLFQFDSRADEAENAKSGAANPDPTKFTEYHWSARTVRPEAVGT